VERTEEWKEGFKRENAEKIFHCQISAVFFHWLQRIISPFHYFAFLGPDISLGPFLSTIGFPQGVEPQICMLQPLRAH
jgi:hypothetical protein